jgi:hypothetical protein
MYIKLQNYEIIYSYTALCLLYTHTQLSVYYILTHSSLFIIYSHTALCSLEALVLFLSTCFGSYTEPKHVERNKTKLLMNWELCMSIKSYNCIILHKYIDKTQGDASLKNWLFTNCSVIRRHWSGILTTSSD